jgi:hypothetical protein
MEDPHLRKGYAVAVLVEKLMACECRQLLITFRHLEP